MGLTVQSARRTTSSQQVVNAKLLILHVTPLILQMETAHHVLQATKLKMVIVLWANHSLQLPIVTPLIPKQANVSNVPLVSILIQIDYVSKKTQIVKPLMIILHYVPNAILALIYSIINVRKEKLKM